MSARNLIDAPAPRFELAERRGGVWSLDEALDEPGGQALVLVFHRHIH